MVVGQRKGLPIGGHLSAAYVELVALKSESEVCSWPASVEGLRTRSYRDNVFVAVPHPRSSKQRDAAAAELTELLQMPVVTRCTSSSQVGGSMSNAIQYVLYCKEQEPAAEIKVPQQGTVSQARVTTCP